MEVAIFQMKDISLLVFLYPTQRKILLLTMKSLLIFQKQLGTILIQKEIKPAANRGLASMGLDE